MNTFKFQDAWSFLESGRSVQDYKGRVYHICEGELYCWPKPVQSPRMKRRVIRITMDLITSDGWRLV